jgi:thioredoxin reductase
MFRSYPIFQRLVTWTKPYAPVDRSSRSYERYDWNSLLAEKEELRGTVAEFMDGSSYFPARSEMQSGLAAFVERTALPIRYGCRWESTKATDDGFIVTTTDGEYRCRVLVIAVGMAEPYKPEGKGFEEVPHYVDAKEPNEYSGKRVFIVGKRNGAFEIADALLPWARQIILASPKPARLSVMLHSPAGARARYLQPYEDHILGGGNVVLDATVERIERTGDGYRVFVHGTTHPGERVLDVDEVIAVTGFKVPLGDLEDLGVATFSRMGLPSQTDYWESPQVPGIYFVGAITQGSTGMMKYGIPGNSAAVHGFRYNSRVLVDHIAEKHFDKRARRTEMKPDDLVPMLLKEVTESPELWHQPSYLARVVTIEVDGSIFDDGAEPLAHFVDSSGPDAIAVTVETDQDGDTHPACYLRRKGKVSEVLLDSDPFHNFTSTEHEKLLGDALKGFIG